MVDGLLALSTPRKKVHGLTRSWSFSVELACFAHLWVFLLASLVSKDSKLRLGVSVNGVCYLRFTGDLSSVYYLPLLYLCYSTDWVKG